MMSSFGEIRIFHEGKVEVGGAEVEYVQCGQPEGKPVVVTSLRGTAIVGHWDWLLEGLSTTNARVICITLPAKTKKVDINIDSPGVNLVTVIKAVLDELQVGRVALAGFDLGGTAALQFAIEEPARTEAVVVFHSWYKKDQKLEKINRPVLVLWVSPDQFHPTKHAISLSNRIPSSSIFVYDARVYRQQNSKGRYRVFAEHLLPPVLQKLEPWIGPQQQQHLAEVKVDGTGNEAKGDDLEVRINEL